MDAAVVEQRVLSAINDFHVRLDRSEPLHVERVLSVIGDCEQVVRERLEARTSHEWPVYVLVGANQVGKTSTVLFLTNDESPLLLRSSRMLELPPNDVDAPLIGAGWDSTTVLPNVREREGMVFVDLPGVFDTRGLLPRLVNTLIARQIFALPNVVIVHVIQNRNSISLHLSREHFGLGTHRNSMVLLTRCEAGDSGRPGFVPDGFDFSVMPYPPAPLDDTLFRSMDSVAQWRTQFLAALQQKTPAPVEYTPSEDNGERALVVALTESAQQAAIRLVQDIVRGVTAITLEQASQLREWLDRGIGEAIPFSDALARLVDVGFTEQGNDTNTRVLRDVRGVERLGGRVSSAWLQPHYPQLHELFPRECVAPALFVENFVQDVDVVCKRSLVLSDALNELQETPGQCRALYVVGLDELHVDVSVTCWANIVCIGERISVAPGVVFDLSAPVMPDAVRFPTQAARGQDGTPGRPGAPGGSLLVVCSTIDGSFDFRSKGQCGGDGQRGGDGVNGATKWLTDDEVAATRAELARQAFSPDRQCWQCSDSCQPRALSDGFHSEPAWPSVDQCCTVTTTDRTIHQAANRPGRGGQAGRGGLAGQRLMVVGGQTTRHGNVEQDAGESGAAGASGAPSRDGWRARPAWTLKCVKGFRNDRSFGESSDFDCFHSTWHWECTFAGLTEVVDGPQYAAHGLNPTEPAEPQATAAPTVQSASAVYVAVLDRIEEGRPSVRLERQRRLFPSV